MSRTFTAGVDSDAATVVFIGRTAALAAGLATAITTTLPDVDASVAVAMLSAALAANKPSDTKGASASLTLPTAAGAARAYRRAGLVITPDVASRHNCATRPGPVVFSVFF